MSTNGKKPTKEKKKFRIKKENLPSIVVFDENGDEYYLAPLRFGKYILTRINK